MAENGLVFVGDFWPLHDISPLSFRELKSAFILNLETSVYDGVSQSAKAYSVFVNESKAQNILRITPSAVNLANNHVFDCGMSGFEKLISFLDDNRIPYFGLLSKPHAELEINGLRCAVIGCLESCGARKKELFPEENVALYIKSIRAEYDRIFVTPHWGKEGEYTHYPSPRQRDLAKKWIEAGADGIFGHHSHTFQGMEYINGKAVYYSLGNFFFPHEESAQYPMTRYGLAVQVFPETDQDVISHFYIENAGKRVGKVENESDVTMLDNVFSNSSREILRLSLWRWGRLVGPVYISKSDKSWRIRLKKNFWKTLPRLMVWSLLPKTIFFRFFKLLSRS